MRPRKRVLLYCADYDRRNHLAFVLRVRNEWAITEPCATIGEVAELLTKDFVQSSAFGCLVLVAAGPGDRKADGQRRNGEGDDLSQKVDFDWLLRDPEVASRTVEVRMPKDMRWSGFAAQCAMAGDIAGLISAMKIAARRKRGPKKGVNVNAPQLEAQAVA